MNKYVIALRVYEEYQNECLNSDGDYTMNFYDYLKQKQIL